MAYSELIKNFQRVREYMRQFYVYGFKSRSEYHGKSPRSYDNERRRVESWLGQYMAFRRDESGKQVFLSVDSRRLQQPVQRNEQGVVLVSGSSPRIFGMLRSGAVDPEQFMLDTLGAERYACITA